MTQFIFFMVVTSGCTSIPTAAHPVTKGKEITKASLEFIELGVTTKAQVIEKLGQPELQYKAVDGYWHIEYSWKRLEGIFLAVTAAGGSAPGIIPWPDTNRYVCIIAFDSNDYVVGAWIVRIASDGRVLPQ